MAILVGLAVCLMVVFAGLTLTPSDPAQISFPTSPALCPRCPETRKKLDTGNSFRNLKDFCLGSDLGRRFWHRESTVLLISLTGPVCPGTFESRPKP